MFAFSNREALLIPESRVSTSNLRRVKLSLIGFTVLLLGLLVWPPQPVGAEGSGDLFGSGNGFRANSEWRNTYYGGTATTSGSVLRRTLLKVYANANEYIMVGSSAMGQGFSPTEQADIRIYNPGLITGAIGKENVPGTASFSCLTQRTQPGLANVGVISRREQEVGGPETLNIVTGIPNLTDPVNLYAPCYYRAPSRGIYNVVFLGPRGDNSDVDVPPSGSIADVPNNFNTTQETNVALWDVTIRPDPTTAFTSKGRLFANYLTLYTGANPRPLFSTLHIVTSDGYIYRSDLNGLDPNGFVVSANQVGYYDSDGTTPLYHDVLAQFFDPNVVPNGRQRQNQLFQLQGGVSLAPPQYPIFFNRPTDPLVFEALGIPTNPINPVVSVPVFLSNLGRGITLYGEGGDFFYNSNVGGVYQLIISRDGVNFDPTNPLNRVLRGARGKGDQSIRWDGRDNAGNLFPVGRNYRISFQVNAGELHFPLLDAENSRRGGPSYELLNPPIANCPNLLRGCTTSFYDDRGYRTANGTIVGTLGVQLCGANPPTIPFTLEGYDSRTDQRGYGYGPNDPNIPANGGNQGLVCTNGGTGAFGDTKGLDLWTFFPSAKSTTVIEIVDEPPTPPPTATPTPGWVGGVLTPTPTSLTPTPTLTPPAPTPTPDPGGSPPATAGSGAVTPTPLPGLPNTGRVPAEPDNWFGWFGLGGGLLLIIAGAWLSFGRVVNRRSRR